MQLSEFVMLSIAEKKSFAIHQGAPLAKRKVDSDCQVFLFQLPEFYLEMFFDVKSKAVKELLIYHDAKHLSLYYNALSLDDLFEK